MLLDSGQFPQLLLIGKVPHICGDWAISMTSHINFAYLKGAPRQLQPGLRKRKICNLLQLLQDPRLDRAKL